MNSLEAQAKFSSYLKKNGINYLSDIDDGASRYTMVYKGMDMSPGDVLESCIWWKQNSAEVRIYYCEVGAKLCSENPQNHPELFRFFNYIAGYLWLKGTDFAGGSLYLSEDMYNPRIYMTEDGEFDITMTFLVNYDFYEVAQLETEDFITATCPYIMNSLSYYIFSIVLGKISADEAIDCLEQSISDGTF